MLLLAWPVMAHMLLNTAVFLAGRVFMGRLSQDALASMQISGPLLWSIQSVFSAFSTGTLAVVGRDVGAGDREGAATAAKVSLRLAMALGVTVAVLTWLLLDVIIHAAFPTASPQVAQHARTYMGVMLLALPLSFVEAVAAASLQAAGDTQTPMRVGVLINVVNMALSPVLMFGLLGAPELGVQGAALGGAAAFALEGALLWWALSRRASPVPLHTAAPSRTMESLRRVLRVSWPAFAEKATYHAGFLTYVGIIGALGPLAMAANQALIALESICFLSAEALGIAASSLVARSLGGRDPGRAAAVVAWSTGMSAGLLGVFAVVMVAAPRTFLGVFSADEALVGLGAHVLPVMLLAEPVMGAALVLIMSLRGAGDTKTVLGITLLCAVLIRVVATWSLAIHWELGLLGVWLGSTVDWTCRALLGAWAWRRGAWKRVEV